MSTDTIPSPAVKECPNCGAKMFEGDQCAACLHDDELLHCECDYCVTMEEDCLAISGWREDGTV